MVTILKGHVRDGVVVPEMPIDLPNGTAAEVRVTMPDVSGRSDRLSILDIIDSLPPGPRLFRSTAEIDAYIENERNSWDR